MIHMYIHLCTYVEHDAETLFITDNRLKSTISRLGVGLNDGPGPE